MYIDMKGKLNGIESAAVLLPYPKESFGKPTALRAFIFLRRKTALDSENIKSAQSKG
jgi:hypothetical protein